jgi:two-component system, OmpR family, sensor histidine kinase CiaH
VPDGAAAPGPDQAEREAIAAEARMIRTVRWRLVFWSGLSTLVVLAILGMLLYWSAARTLEASGVQQLSNRTDQVVEAIKNPRGRPDGPEFGFIFGGNTSGTFAMAIDADGNNLGRGIALPPGLPVRDSLAAAIDKGTDVRPAAIGALPIRAMTERVDSPVGVVYIQVIQDRTAEQQTLDAILRVLFVGGAVVVLVSVAFGAIYARRALVPIRESLDSQRTALRRQRDFAADASHELRTPLTVIRSSVEHLRRNRGEAAATTEALDDIDAEVGQMTALVDDLLLLARSDSGAITLSRMPVDIGDVAADGAGAMAKPAADRGVSLALDPEPAIVRGDQARLRQLIVILVDNAIRHTPRGGSVLVRVRADHRDVTLEVDDDGPGIRPADMPQIFDRFWRAPGAQAGGTGLGLAIAKSIVDLHDGRITVSNRPKGGARFMVRLPAEEQPPAPATDPGPILAPDGPR